MDGADGEDRGAGGDRRGHLPPRPARGLLQRGHEHGAHQQQGGGGVPAEVEVQQVQQQGEQRDEHDDDHGPGRAEHQRRQAGGELLHAEPQHLGLGGEDRDRPL